MFKYFISIAAAALLATSMLGRTIWASFQPEDTGGIVYGGNYQGNEFTDVGLIPPGKFVILGSLSSN